MSQFFCRCLNNVIHIALELRLSCNNQSIYRFICLYYFTTYIVACTNHELGYNRCSISTHGDCIVRCHYNTVKFHPNPHKQGKSGDLIAATGLIILIKFDPNHRFFSPFDLEIWCMTSKKIGHLFYTTSNFVYHFKSMGELKLKLHSGKTQFGSKSAIFCPLWPWNLMDDLGKR